MTEYDPMVRFVMRTVAVGTLTLMVAIGIAGYFIL